VEQLPPSRSDEAVGAENSFGPVTCAFARATVRAVRGRARHRRRGDGVTELRSRTIHPNGPVGHAFGSSGDVSRHSVADRGATRRLRLWKATGSARLHQAQGRWTPRENQTTSAKALVKAPDEFSAPTGLRRVIARRAEFGLAEPILHVRPWPLELVNSAASKSSKGRSTPCTRGRTFRSFPCSRTTPRGLWPYREAGTPATLAHDV
jgi:hypothetical protein